MPMMLYTYADGSVKLTPIQISNTPIPCPSEWQIGYSDLHKNSERNASGYLTADRVRANVRKHELKWAFLLPGDFSALKTILSASMFMPMDYIEGDAQKSMTAYKGDISATPYRLLQTGEIQGYRNVSVDLIER